MSTYFLALSNIPMYTPGPCSLSIIYTWTLPICPSFPNLAQHVHALRALVLMPSYTPGPHVLPFPSILVQNELVLPVHVLLGLVRPVHVQEENASIVESLTKHQLTDQQR
jgi:hypothetical protein